MKMHAIAFTSFVIGVYTTFLGIGAFQSQTTVFAEQGGQDLSSVNVAIPRIPGLIDATHDHETSTGDAPLLLDGFQSRDSIYAGNYTIVYGGGAYKLDHVALAGPFKIQLVGAAANTAHFLESVGLLRDVALPPAAPPRTKKKTPTIKDIPKSKILGDFVSPYDGN